MKNCIPLLVLLLISIFFLTFCSQHSEYLNRADELAHEFIIVDGHVDLPYRLRNNWADISQRTDQGDFDYVRAREGGLDAPFMSIYVPVEYQEKGGAKALADSLIDMVVGLTDEHPDKFALASSPSEVRSNFDKGLISFPMGIENGAAIEGDLANLVHFYDRGIRYITLAHARDNRISDSSYDTTANTHEGLSAFGEKVVREMNRLGIMVDVSHITDSAFYDVMEVTEAPAIASHSSCRHFTPGWERNMSDEMIKRLAENGGVIMINFGSSFLDESSRKSGDKLRDEIAEYFEEENLDRSQPQAQVYAREQFQQYYDYATVSRAADHIDHVVDLVGVEHVGLGSDFDGVGNTLPEGLKDASMMPNLLAELLERGYTAEEIEKICSGNIFRVWSQVDETAGNLQE